MTTEISVVIGFRDWGINRLRLASTSILKSFGQVKGEVILSDYGSEEPSLSRSLAAEMGLKHVYTEDAPVWSRARALNAGFAAAKGRLLVSTDADMIFSPRAFEKIAEIARNDENSAFFLQCRDLPSGMDDTWISANAEAWPVMEERSRLRPRWGMGGMMAIGRSGFEEIRGFDERLHTYGGEDLDFAQRARRAGYRTCWVTDEEVRMYHMWHPPTQRVVEETEEGKAAVSFNRNVVYHDKTFVRNPLLSHAPVAEASPLITVAICTRNRGDLIGETIQSILAQTVQDFEIVVVDDGGEDHLEDTLSSLGDERIHYFWQEPAGISSARNRALDQSRGIYTAVIDDDDLMHPRRLEWHLNDLVEGLDGNVGSFVNFDDETGSLHLFVSAKPATYTAFDKGTAPGHGTWFIKTSVLKKFRYDESITSGVDNNLMLRMLRSGVRLGHTGRPVTLRRMHPRQVTVTDSIAQGGAAVQSLSFFRWNLGNYYNNLLVKEREAEGAFPSIESKPAMLDELVPFLPDHLVKRDILFSEPVEFKNSRLWDGHISATTVKIGQFERTFASAVQEASYGDLVRARQCGRQFEVVVRESTETRFPSDNYWLGTAVEIVKKKGSMQGDFALVSPLSDNGLSERNSVVVTHFEEEERIKLALSPMEDNNGRLANRRQLDMVVGPDFFMEF